jgi:hypothetical protein
MENVVLHPAMLSRIAWLDFPAIDIIDPIDGEKTIRASISDETIHRLYRANRKTAIWQAWAHLVGELPPIPNISIIRGAVPKGGFCGPLLANACFKGVKRPYCDDEDGGSILVYILKPSFTLAMQTSLVCVAKAQAAPRGTVLAVYVRCQETLHPRHGKVSGTITGWEFIPAVSEAEALPDKHRERYGAELWRR